MFSIRVVGLGVSLQGAQVKVSEQVREEHWVGAIDTDQALTHLITGY